MKREEEIQKYADELAQQYFPDESNIWARRNIEAESVYDACMRMAKYIEQELIEKSCEWLEENYYNGYQGTWQEIKEQFINDFKKAMEE